MRESSPATYFSGGRRPRMVSRESYVVSSQCSLGERPTTPSSRSECHRRPHSPSIGRTARTRGERFLFYSHDGLGLGHLRRNLSVARALAELAPEASILLATSAEEAQRFELPPNVDILRLPGPPQDRQRPLRGAASERARWQDMRRDAREPPARRGRLVPALAPARRQAPARPRRRARGRLCRG